MFNGFFDIIIKKPHSDSSLKARQSIKVEKSEDLEKVNKRYSLSTDSSSSQKSDCQNSVEFGFTGIKSGPTCLPSIRAEIRKIHENVSIVQSLIPLLNNGSITDGNNLIKQLQETNVRLQSLLPMINVFMNQFPPGQEEGMELWKIERENLGREFESTLTTFQTVQQDLMDAMKALTKQNSKK